MMKKTLVTALAVASATLGTQAMAWEEGSLTIWIGSDKGYNGLQEVGDVFADDTGITVTVETPDDATGKFQQEAAIGKGPDVFIWAHDRFGSWAKSGLISPVSPSKDVMKALDDSFWAATSYNGQVYGYPINVEGPTQICNTDIVDKPFKSIDEVREAAPGLAAQGKKALMWDYNNTYFTYGFLTAEGGYAFEQVDGSYNSKVTGVNTPGAIAGAQMIKDLIDEGVMPAGVDYGVFDAAFKAGEVACVINGPWAWADYQKAGIDFELAPYPKVGKGKPRAFTGVLSAGINASSPNKELAVEFIENYLLTEEGLTMVNDDRALGAVTHKKFMKKVGKEDKRIAEAFKVWTTSEPMPNVPEMDAFWSNMEAALTSITQGAQTAEAALNDAAARITE
ncbi:maltose/maltodextrin ABC transporter substrate-binding protein MalE [Reinekea forsetii]|nr:maltose/maltodextrin ABC transporter substrate-binding protein MalE [Reinekea forsetii]